MNFLNFATFLISPTSAAKTHETFQIIRRERLFGFHDLYCSKKCIFYPKFNKNHEPLNQLFLIILGRYSILTVMRMTFYGQTIFSDRTRRLEKTSQQNCRFSYGKSYIQLDTGPLKIVQFQKNVSW